MSWIGGRHDKIGIGSPIFGTFAKEGKGEREEGTHDEDEDDGGGRKGMGEGGRREGEEGCGIGRRRARGKY